MGTATATNKDNDVNNHGKMYLFFAHEASISLKSYASPKYLSNKISESCNRAYLQTMRSLYIRRFQRLVLTLCLRTNPDYV